MTRKICVAAGWIFTLTLIAMPVYAAMTGDAASSRKISVVYFDAGQTFSVPVLPMKLLNHAGISPSSNTSEDLAYAIVHALAHGLTGEIAGRSAAGWFPDGRLDSVKLMDGKVHGYLTLPDAYLTGLTDPLLNAISSAFYLTLSSAGFKGALISVKPPGRGTYQPLSAYLPVPPPVPPKPYEESAQDTADGKFAGQPAPHGQGQYAGSLWGKSIFLSPGHGWYYDSGSAWITQRGNTNDIVEDLSNAEAVDNYLIQYFWNAGAGVYTCRERDINTHEVIVDNTDAEYSDTGGWFDTTSTPDYYGSNYRAVQVVTSGTAEASWTFSPPADGTYSVYVWYTGGANRSTDAAYTVHHAGGDTVIIQNQQRDGYTWKNLGFFYFSASDPESRRQITLTNDGSDPTKYVIADAVRFGGGMGTIMDGGMVSGRPRWEESGLYHAEYMGCASCPTNRVTTMPRYTDWESESWEDSVYVSWHTNALDGATSGTSSFAFSSAGWGGTFDGVPNSLELRDYIHNELINDIRAGYDAGWRNGLTHTNTYGEINPTHNDEAPGAIIEIAFHDNPADALYLKDPKFRMIAARAIYQGVVKFYAWKDGATTHFLPEPPENLRVFNIPGNAVRVEWDAPPYNSGDDYLGDAATGYRVYTSDNGFGFADGMVTSNTYYEITNVDPGDVIFIRVTAVNAGGESFSTPTLAARLPLWGESAPLLIVDGFDRLDRSAMITQYESSALGTVQRMFLDRMNTYAYTVTHALAAMGYGCGFDSCVNEAVEDSDVSLLDYQAVDWIIGEDSTVDESLNTAEQTLLTAYLNAGNGLFVSGAEIGWDLDALGSSGDRSFYNTSLRADYVADDAGSYAVSGTSGSIFQGMSSLAFDDGTDIYDVDFPDCLAALNSSIVCLTYDSTAYNAGVQYDGAYKLVHFGFPFETFVNAPDRELVMETVLNFLLGAPVPSPTATETAAPSPTATMPPTITPTDPPTGTPTTIPTDIPATASPTLTATPPIDTPAPTQTSTSVPTANPTPEPTADPTAEPTILPTPEPTILPTPEPTPTITPAQIPTTGTGGILLLILAFSQLIIFRRRLPLIK